MTTPTTIAELAKSTEALLVETGWCQNAMARPDGKVCLVAAINLAAYDSVRPVWDGTLSDHISGDLATPAILHMSAAFQRLGLIGDEALWEWNDDVVEGWTEVRDALEAVKDDSTPIDLLAGPVGRYR